MRRELHAEWTKLRTTASAGWLLLALVVLTVAATAAATATVSCPPDGCGYDVGKLGLFGVQAGQAVVVILAILAVTGEYNTGMIRTTLSAMPRRGTVLAAKTVLVTGMTLAAGVVGVLGSVVVGRLILPGNGFTLYDLTDGPMLRASVGSVLYLGLIAVLSLGVATMVRDAAVAIGVVFGLLFVLSVVPMMVDNTEWQRFLWRISPMNAGLAIQATTDLSSLPLSPWAGLGVLALWAIAALLAGGLLLHSRDA